MRDDNVESKWHIVNYTSLYLTLGCVAVGLTNTAMSLYGHGSFISCDM